MDNLNFLKFINKVKFKLMQYIEYKKNIYFYKKVYWNIINNLTELNFINYYKDFNHYYLKILDEMDKFKEVIDELPILNNFKYYKIIVIKKKLIKLMNFVSPKKLNLILDLIQDNWLSNFTNEENVQLVFLIDFIRPICLWNSEIHISSKESGSNIIIHNSSFNNIIITNSLDKPRKDWINNNDDIIINNNYDIDECSYLLYNTNLLIQKNKKAISLIENKYGCSIFIKLNNRYLVIQGIFNDDLFNMALKNPFVKNLFENHINHINTELKSIPNSFSLSYYNILNLRDKIILQPKELCEEIKKKYNDFKLLQPKPLMLLINEFLLGSKFRKIDILTLFLISNEDDCKLAYILFDIFKNKDKKNITSEIYNSLHYSLRKQLDIAKENIETLENEIMTLSESDISYERKISLLNTDIDIKEKAIDKLKSIKNNFQGDSKAQNWLDGLLKIPFNIYNENEIMSFKKNLINKLDVKLISDYEIDNYFDKNINSSFKEEWIQHKINKKEYLYNARKILDTSIYGHKEAKIELERIFAQWINGKNTGAVLGLHGPPGTGKTSLIKNGLSKCLNDDKGTSRPFAFLPIGGSVNGSTLVGHNYTYVGSTWGRIVDILISTKCMNPIIFIDELDKVSNTEHGREIISILTHLTDSTQNDEFEDKFFAGIKLNLSKALIIFSFNDISLIDHVLKDRITIIETHPLKIKEKVVIIRDYILPEICNQVGFNTNEINLSDSLIEFLIETYTNEPGVRKIKEKIVEIIREINLQKFYSDIITFPYSVTTEFCEKLFEAKPKVKPKRILKEPTVGVVNGLYASTSGIGGITFIQAIKFPSDKMLELNLTGSLGDSMKESIQYSLKLAFRLLSPELQEKILNGKTFGIHIHCPEGAVKKDGPSAGGAITLAIYSLLTNMKVNNKFAMTGEIDLLGNITAIGGLEAKLNGAKKAGVEIALFPEENLEDLKILENQNISPECDTFKLISVNNINQVFEIALIK
jgi:ATP-dependent Lon protease